MNGNGDCETAKDKKDDENNVVLTTEQLQMLDDQRQELADLRRQVVYLQVNIFAFSLRFNCNK